MPEEVEIGYGDAAQLYWDAGWPGVLPLRRGKKFPPPGGRTGHDGEDPSYPDLLQYCELYQDGNLALRMPDTVVGIDIDAYNGKTGARTIAEAEKRWGPLPPAPKSTSRMNSDPISGIRFFKVPAGTQLQDRIQFTELSIGDIEIVQRVHRYAVVWPSIHPEGPGYWWYNHQNQQIGVPNVDELPELPEAWIAGLREQPIAAVLDFGSIDINACLTAGDPSPRVAYKLSEAIRGINTSEATSRHDTIRDHVLTLMRYGKDGDPGVYNALLGLQELYVHALTTGPHARGDRESAINEFRRMITNRRAAQLLAEPSKDDWVRELIQETVEEVKAEIAAETAPEPEVVPNPVPVAPGPAPSTDPTITATYRSQFQEQLEQIEQGFWNSRQSLRTIFNSATSRMAPPWGVLAVAVARAMCLVPPRITLPPIIGGKASLNQFFGLVSPSGGGKGISGAVGAELVPNFINERKLGSPEGLLTPFRDNPKDPDARLEAVWFNMAEIDGFRGVGSRNKTGGTDLMALIRECWDGAAVGFGWIDNVFVEAHTYRMTLTVGIQPLRAGWLLADRGGTPQRFMWFPARDERANRRNRDGSFWIPALNLPSGSQFMYPRTLAVPKEVEDMIVEAQEAKNYGQLDALDGHAVQARERFAYALAVIDGRIDMTLEDWELAGIASQVSSFTREWCKDGAKEGAVLEAEERGELRGVENYAADLEKDQRYREQLQRVIRWLMKKLTEAGEFGMSQSELTRAVYSKDRKVFPAALDKAVEDGFVRCQNVDGAVRWWLR